MTKDLLKTLEAMRPGTGAERLWPQHLQSAEQARIMATTTGSRSVASATRPKRFGAVALTAALVTVGGIGVAAATGMMPKAFTDHYNHWNEPGPVAEPVDPASAERLASIPGPDGTVFSVVMAHGASSQRCVTSVFESVASAEQPGPSEFTDLGSRCRNDGDGGFGDGAGAMVASFGEGGGGEVRPKELVYDAAAGTAVRAELHTSTGQVLPTILADGSFFGWFPMPSPGSPRPILTGYAPDGTIVGSIEIGPNF